MPGTRFEATDGTVVYVHAANQALGSRRSKLSALLESHVVRGYGAAIDMLTRTSAMEDLAPDASIYAIAPDHKTAGRRLEELAFEVVSTEMIGAPGRRRRR